MGELVDLHSVRLLSKLESVSISEEVPASKPNRRTCRLVAPGRSCSGSVVISVFDNVFSVAITSEVIGSCSFSESDG